MVCRLGIALVLLLAACAALASGHREIQRGVKAYYNGDYDKALKSFGRVCERLEGRLAKEGEGAADEDLRTFAIASFDMGAALYKKGEYQQAALALLKSISTKTTTPDSTLRSEALYNLGNCFYQTDSLNQALKSYAAATLLNPDDEDAKYNLELVLRKLKSRGGGGGEKREQSSQQQSQQGEQSQPQRGEQKHKEPRPQESRAKQERSQETQQRAGMSKEQAEQLLNAMERQELEMLQNWMKQRTQRRGGRKYCPRDW